MTRSSIYVGIGVSEAELDVARLPTDDQWGVANGDRGIATLVARMRSVDPALVVRGATGALAKTNPLGAAAAAGFASSRMLKNSRFPTRQRSKIEYDAPRAT